MVEQRPLAFASTPSGAVAWNGLGEPLVMNHSAAAICEALLSGCSTNDVVSELSAALGAAAPADDVLVAAVTETATLIASAADSGAQPPRIDPSPTGPSVCDAIRFQLDLDAVRVLPCDSDGGRSERRLAVSIPDRDALRCFDDRWGAHSEVGPPALDGAPVAFGLRTLTGPDGRPRGERLLVRGGAELWRSRNPNETRSLLHRLLEFERRVVWRPGTLHAACYTRGEGADAEVALIPLQLLEPLAVLVARLGRIGWRPAPTLWPVLNSDGLIDLGEAGALRLTAAATRHVGVDPASSLAAPITGAAWEAVHLLGASRRPHQELLEGAGHTLSAVEHLLTDPPLVFTPERSADSMVSMLAAPI